jgi:hypothetical protein
MRRQSFLGVLAVCASVFAVTAWAAPVVEVRATGVISSSSGDASSPFAAPLVGQTATVVHTYTYTPTTVSANTPQQSFALFDAIGVELTVGATTVAWSDSTAALPSFALYTLTLGDIPNAVASAVDSQLALEVANAEMVQSQTLVSSLLQNLMFDTNLLQSFTFALPLAGISATTGLAFFDDTGGLVWDLVVNAPTAVTVTVSGLPGAGVPLPASAPLVILGVALLLLMRQRRTWAVSPASPAAALLPR